MLVRISYLAGLFSMPEFSVVISSSFGNAQLRIGRDNDVFCRADKNVPQPFSSPDNDLDNRLDAVELAEPA